MKHFLFITMLALAVLCGYSAPVDVATAETTAQQFALNLASHGIHRAPAMGNGSITLVHTEKNQNDASRAIYYIFNTDDSYIIVSGDDRAYEVLAYGDRPIDMNHIPDGMRYWLDCFRQDLEYLQAHPDLVVEPTVHRAPARNAASVEPLLSTMWDQSAPYYYQCPVSNGEYCLTGCAATSLSMICHFWRYPSAITTTLPGYTTGSLHMAVEPLGPTTFDYDNMLDNYYRGHYNNTQANAVAKLMRYVGQAEHMDYTPSSSGVTSWDINQAIRTLDFDSDAKMVYKDNYSNEDWAVMIQDELYMGHPLEYCGFGGMSGHAFNVDGYDGERDMYHINWGWSGSGNGYCALNAFKGGGSTYRNGQLMIIGLIPPPTVPTIKVNTPRLNISGIAGKQNSKSFTVKGALLTNGVTITLNDNSGLFTVSTNYISTSELVNGKSVKVNYNPDYSGTHSATLTLSSAGADDVVIAINGTAVLETYDPVMLDAVDVTTSSFKVQWSDQTPTQNLSSYRLEMAKIPYSESMLQEDFRTVTASGSSDCSSHLDDLTSAPGWTGSKVFTGDGYIRLGSSVAKGWLQTPEIDMRDNDDLVTVRVTARNASTAGEALLQISCGDADTTIVANGEAKQYCVLLPCVGDEHSTVRISTRIKGQRLLIHDMEVLAGDAYKSVDLSTATYHNNITGTNYHMGNIIPGSYGLRVQATYSDGTVSEWSNRVNVRVNWKVGDVNHDNEVNIADVNSIIAIIMGEIDSRQTIKASDLNGDGDVNVADINALIEIILSGE